MKKITGIILLLLAAIILAACQANYIRDVGDAANLLI